MRSRTQNTPAREHVIGGSLMGLLKAQLPSDSKERTECVCRRDFRLRPACFQFDFSELEASFSGGKHTVLPSIQDITSPVNSITANHIFPLRPLFFFSAFHPFSYKHLHKLANIFKLLSRGNLNLVGANWVGKMHSLFFSFLFLPFFGMRWTPAVSPPAPPQH